jgi:hypothetical protein
MTWGAHPQAPQYSSQRIRQAVMVTYMCKAHPATAPHCSQVPRWEGQRICQWSKRHTFISVILSHTFNNGTKKAKFLSRKEVLAVSFVCRQPSSFLTRLKLDLPQYTHAPYLGLGFSWKTNNSTQELWVSHIPLTLHMDPSDLWSLCLDSQPSSMCKMGFCNQTRDHDSYLELLSLSSKPFLE